MIKTILTCMDNPSSLDAPVKTAAEIALQNHAELNILHVLESSSKRDRKQVKHYKTGVELKTSPEYESEVLEEIKKQGSHVFKDFSHVKVKITTGFPWEEISRVSDETGASLIVMGPHSEGAMEKGVVRVAGRVGSTAEGVISREKCPVMIVGSSLAKGFTGFGKIMACIDFSSSCEYALKFSVETARQFSSHLILFHMMTVPPYPKYSREEYMIDFKKTEARMKEFSDHIIEGIECDIVLYGGASPHQEILRTAEKFDVDLIVMGSHTRNIRGKWYSGSAVERVSYRSLCPVIIINDPHALIAWYEHINTIIEQGKDRLIHAFSRDME